MLALHSKEVASWKASDSVNDYLLDSGLRIHLYTLYLFPFAVHCLNVKQ